MLIHYNHHIISKGISSSDNKYEGGSGLTWTLLFFYKTIYMPDHQILTPFNMSSLDPKTFSLSPSHVNNAMKIKGLILTADAVQGAAFVIIISLNCLPS
jgi:hypothetical protein